jgi:putative endonuclease
VKITRSELNKEQRDQTNTELGRKGEKLAADYLIGKGLELIQFNYRKGRAEIDIIALDKKVLVFVEVKFRTSTKFGFPEEFVDKGKVKRIKTAAESYIFEKNWTADIRFDIVSIVELRNITIEHFIDCF